MRLFIAIELPETLKQQLTRLKTDIPGTVWARHETYHLTLRFLGDNIPPVRLADLQTELAKVEQPAFAIQLQGVGRFPPNPKKAARVLWVGVAPNPSLQALYGAVEQAVTALNFPPDDHDFHAHITLARLKSVRPEAAVDAFLKRHADLRAGAFPVEAFYLFSSTLTPQGAQYSLQGEFPLKKALLE